MSGRFLAIGVALLVVATLGAGYGGYQLGLRASSPGRLTASSFPTPTKAPAAPAPASTASTGPYEKVDPVHNPVVDALSCKLPVYVLGQQGTGGFISFPDGAITADAKSSGLHLPGGGTDWFGLAFGGTTKRWLPVPTAWVSPDGSLYVYMMDWNSHAGANGLWELNAQTDSAGSLGGVGGNGSQVIGMSSTNIYLAPLQGQGAFVQPITGAFAPQPVSGGYFTRPMSSTCTATPPRTADPSSGWTCASPPMW